MRVYGCRRLGGEKDSREGRARAAKPGGCRRGRGGGREGENEAKVKVKMKPK